MWEDSETQSSLRIQFEKLEMVADLPDYEDILVGEYHYVENNITMVNTLPLVSNSDDIYTHSLYLIAILGHQRGVPPCEECADDTRYLNVQLLDSTREGLLGEMKMAHFVEDGIEKIRARIYLTYNSNFDVTADDTGPNTLSIPEGIYTFIKQ